ncbi:DNA repair protein RecO [Candidatus Collierbacteria bacterium RIFCSPLOWO2_01_FULL_50_23]|uniref:DNA repair protein RecO n=1 Tax=Candidatus Collierbacteria bacterium RIFCSPHIGHO2_01_FULL_50_25 TaxID=1817722 RepID=A0A1F5EWT5_9BACT|nr:MAG: DNA repair protein RecO [Candidatus Collierbacteria bacterium RIFCSPHIGHO2_01_FULL_50_25]OGD74629.1 MAG: DNA repair protein RecO [Candidatus Collierbacteria bacterium RIFCSPLOWO2_01_FULL_50_23]
MSASISDVGIIIHQTRFGEADKFVKILSEHHGLIDTVAKGARRLTSRKSGHLDNLNLIRFSTNRGSTPQYLSQVETVSGFPNIKSNLHKVRTCFYLTEIMHHTLVEGEADDALFFAFKNFLESLDRLGDNESSRDQAVEFQHFLIGHLGFPQPADERPEALVSYFESLIDRHLISPKLTLSPANALK